METQRKVLRKPDLYPRVRLSDPTIWRLEKAGKFPRRIKLGAGSVGWFEDEVDAWLDEKARERE